MNIDQIAQQLTDHVCNDLRAAMEGGFAREVIMATLEHPEQRHSFRNAVAMQITKERMYLQLKLAHSKKSETEAESSFSFEPELPGVSEKGGAK